MTLNNSKIHISIGIAAYNAESNIERMLLSLCEQSNTNYILDSLVVYSDCSSDKTVENARKIVSEYIQIIEGTERKGFAGAVKFLLTNSSSELTILLNDDIVIADQQFLEKLVRGYLISKSGLICGNPQPIKVNNFISKAIISSFNAYYRTAISFKNGDNLHTHDGKVLVFSKDYKESLVFPTDLKLMGNVDTFFYYSCLQNGFTYHFVKSAVVGYLCPTTTKDFLRWFIRNNANDPIMKVQFGQLVDRESRKPGIVFLYYLFLEFLKNPLGGLFLFVMGFYIRFKAQKYAQNFDQTWEVVASTKRLSRI